MEFLCYPFILRMRGHQNKWEDRLDCCALPWEALFHIEARAD